MVRLVPQRHRQPRALRRATFKGMPLWAPVLTGLLLVVLSLAPLGASAQEQRPALYDVTGVAPGEGLNVRMAPGTGAPVQGQLAHDARGIEVVDIRDGWGLIQMGEVGGWAYLRYLARRATIETAPVIECVGTEPFWLISLPREGAGRLATPETEDISLRPGALRPSANRPGHFGITAMAEGLRLDGVIREAACSDGMSDQHYGLSVDMLLSGAQDRVLSGCCALSDN